MIRYKMNVQDIAQNLEVVEMYLELYISTMVLFRKTVNGCMSFTIFVKKSL